LVARWKAICFCEAFSRKKSVSTSDRKRRRNRRETTVGAKMAQLSRPRCLVTRWEDDRNRCSRAIWHSLYQFDRGACPRWPRTTAYEQAMGGDRGLGVGLRRARVNREHHGVNWRTKGNRLYRVPERRSKENHERSERLRGCQSRGRLSRCGDDSGKVLLRCVGSTHRKIGRCQTDHVRWLNSAS